MKHENDLKVLNNYPQENSQDEFKETYRSKNLTKKKKVVKKKKGKLKQSVSLKNISDAIKKNEKLINDQNAQKEEIIEAQRYLESEVHNQNPNLRSLDQNEQDYLVKISYQLKRLMGKLNNLEGITDHDGLYETVESQTWASSQFFLSELVLFYKF